MPRKPLVEREELAQMIGEGMSYAEIAQATGLQVTGVKQAAQRYKLARKKLSHRHAIPWRVTVEHNDSVVRKYLSLLSATGQGGTVSTTELKSALRWADNLINQNLDVDYDPDKPPSDFSIQGGFYTKPADKSDWHIYKITQQAKNRLLRRT